MGLYDRAWFWEERERRSRPRTSTLPWWQKALVGVVAAVASVSAVMAIRIWLVERAFDGMQRQAVESSARIQQQVHTSTQRMLAEQQRQSEARQMLERAKRQSMTEAERERAQAYRAEIAERERKERAWDRYYRPPPQCDSTNTDIDLVECANRHIRAKREFEAKYAAGQI